VPDPFGLNRVYRPYWEWEDYDAGMYANPRNVLEEAARARDLLADPARLEPAMQAVTDTWPNSTEHQLTNPDQNRRAWLGQAACRLAADATALATRAAWPQLTDDQRAAANACADRVIREWAEDHTDALALFTIGDLRNA
jgi:hypothetical protein